MKLYSISPNIKSLWERVLIWLRIVLPADGMEITDHVIRWCRLDDGVPQTFAVKVPPGVMQDGKILDRAAFAALMVQVHDAGSGSRSAATKDLVVLTLGSAPTFMHLFYLPLIERNSLDKAIILNLQMISPSDGAATSAGWQVLTEDAEKNRFEVVGVFINRALIDEMTEVLYEVGFVTVAVESKALSLARALAKGGSGLDVQGSYIMVSCDDTGMDFMIIRKGVLCFAYAIPWHEIANEQGQVEDEQFAAALTRGVRQITNFYEQHWSDPVTAAVIAADNLLPTVQATVAGVVSYPVVPFMVGTNDAVRGAPVAFGAALRGVVPHRGDRDVTLLRSDASEVYQEESAVFFLRFWRFALPMILGFVVIAAALGDIIWLGRIEQAATSAVPAVSAGVVSQLATLTPAAQHFNQTVTMIQAIEVSRDLKSAVVTRFEAVAASSGITITHLMLGAHGTPTTIAGTASSEDAIVAFKGALISNALAVSVALPLSGIQPQGAGYTFTMTAN